MAPELHASELRILFLITDLAKGGAERFLIDLCNALLDRSDVALRVGSLLPGNEYEAFTRRIPIVQLNYRPFSFRGGNANAAYRELLEDFKPDVVHTHRFLAEFLSAQHVSENITYVCHAHDNMVQFANFGPGTLLDRSALTNWLEKRYLIRRKYRRVRTSFVANSTHTLQYFRSVLPRFMRDDVHLVRYGFDYGRFSARSRRIRRPGERLRLVNVGSFQDKKNQIFIVAIARELRKSGIDFEIDLLGDGANRARVQAEVDRHGLGERIRLHGNVDHVEEWLWRSDLYLHTAWYEPFGLVLLEAMAAGLPCIVLDGKGDRDVIEQGRNGYLIEEQDPALFAARIQELASSPQRYEVMSAYAREYAKAFDMKQAADRFVAFYHECRRRGPRPPGRRMRARTAGG